MDLNHVYIDGPKISANAGKYSWVWKKSCEKNRIKLFVKITELLKNMNAGTVLLGVKFDIREEYAIEYLEEILKKYIELVGFDPGKAVHGKGNHKTSEQRLIEKFSEYIDANTNKVLITECEQYGPSLLDMIKSNPKVIEAYLGKKKEADA